MIIGSCTIHLHIAAAQSLKDKRQVVRSLIARIRNEFNVSVAEVDDQDRWQSAIIGVAVVATDRVHAQRQLESVVSFIERNRPDCPLLTYEIELL